MKILADDLHVLTGSYALDAVPDPERAEFERHLQHCPSCDAEVRGLRETAARLAMAQALAPPPISGRRFRFFFVANSLSIFQDLDPGSPSTSEIAEQNCSPRASKSRNPALSASSWSALAIRSRTKRRMECALCVAA